MGKKLTANDFEAMTIHEVADVLLILAQVLRRLPDVPVSDLLEQPEVPNADKLLARFRQNKGSSEGKSLPDCGTLYDLSNTGPAQNI
ncbi:MAG TPA: hypothetical protein VEL31_30610 [Ktedonobacteraceae bacterium]|nr:hypothetical protein [Ktedonobacteraceae bacterium]